MVSTSRFLAPLVTLLLLSPSFAQQTSYPAPTTAPVASAPAAPATSYSAPPPATPPPVSPFGQMQGMPQFQMPPDAGMMPTNRGQLPFDPSQFRGFNPTGQPTTAPQPREEKFEPSEVLSGLPPSKGNSDLRAVLRTSLGDITIRLDRLNAPQTVQHFVALARGDKEFIDVKTSKRVRRPFYNGLTFHRVSKGFLIQTGCPFGNGRGGPGDIAMIRDEIKPNMNFNKPGLVAMAPMRGDNGVSNKKDSNGSQFFISLAPNPEWDGKFTVFGEVEEGMDVVQKIASVKVGPTERPIKRVFLAAVDIFEGNAGQQQQVPAAAPPEGVPVGEAPQPPAQ